ncbi:MAG TPA: hypothetical protein VF765_36585 [Polyangiaceae bacterium]
MSDGGPEQSAGPPFAVSGALCSPPMRAFMELVEAGALIVRTVDLEAKLDADALAALRGAGILRPTDFAGHEEISPTDFFRALRALYRIEGRGLPVAGVFDRSFQCIGWMRDEGGDRAVVFVANPRRALNITLHYPQRALVLVPTARAVTARHREQHGPGRWVHVEALEEALSAKGGRLARGDQVSPPAAVSSTASPAPRAQIEGLERWNLLRVCKVNSKMVRFDVGKRRYRRTPVDLGLAHKSSRAPKRPWELLIELCDGHGYFKSWRFGTAQNTRKQVERLAKAMCAHFGLEDTPFHRYRRDSGWRTKFVARPDLPDGISEGEDDDD